MQWYVNRPRFLHLHSDYSTIENLSLSSAVACPDPVHLAPVEGNELKSRKRKKPLFEWRWIGQPIQESRPSPSELRYRSDAVDTIVPCNVKFYNKVSRVRGILTSFNFLMHSCCLGVRLIICGTL